MAASAKGRSARLETVDLDLHPNEASDLLPVESRQLLRTHGWDMAFWTVLDEGRVEDCLAVIGHRKGAGHDSDAWQIARPRLSVTKRRGKTEDAEACARHDGSVYVVGSHYGSKDGPLESKRAFLARFREEDFEGGVTESQAEVEVALNRFRVHRAVNDALRAFGPPLLEPSAEVRRRFIEAARRKAGTKRAQRLHRDDSPLNVEGAAFRDDGSLLLGLRFPVTADGHPIVAELHGVEHMFEDRRAAPVARRFWFLQNVGTKRRPLGIRAMHRRGDELHAIVGNLESPDSDAVVLEGHPRGAKASCSHYRFKLPAAADGGAITARLVQKLGLGNVEGLASDSRRRFLYVTDEDDRVHMRYLRRTETRRPRASKPSRRAEDGRRTRSRKRSAKR